MKVKEIIKLIEKEGWIFNVKREATWYLIIQLNELWIGNP